MNKYSYFKKPKNDVESFGWTLIGAICMFVLIFGSFWIAAALGLFDKVNP